MILGTLGFIEEETSAGTRLVDPYCGDVAPRVEIIDLNVDGVAEVFVHWGNTCTSGTTGSSIVLFVKDGQGRYVSHLGFPAAEYRVHARATGTFRGA